MKITRLADARPYDAANHWGTVSIRLQGFEPDGALNQWMGLSHYLPNGHAGPDSSPVEKIYFVVDGRLTVIAGDQEVVLERWDSCTIAANEVREVVNRSNEVATMIVVIPYTKAG